MATVRPEDIRLLCGAELYGPSGLLNVSRQLATSALELADGDLNEAMQLLEAGAVCVPLEVCH